MDFSLNLLNYFYVSNNTNIIHLISVIVPAFNEVENLKRLLPRLVYLANGHPVEILISLGVCTADYSEVVNNLDHVSLVANGRKGRAKQMNDAVAVSKGDILVFLHADVLPPEHFFEDIIASFSNGFQAGFFSYQFDRESTLLRINASFTKKDGLFTGGGDQCLFLKRSVFEKLHGFDEQQVLMEDFEFFKRMKKNGVRYTIVDNPLTVSARKYEDNSYLRVNLVNLFLVILFKMGLAPSRLKSLHDRFLRLPYQKEAL
jgi:rSAM/selenodomain-associated transferase 2